MSFFFTLKQWREKTVHRGDNSDIDDIKNKTLNIVNYSLRREDH